MRESVTVKLGYRPKQLAEATGLSLPFIRKKIREGEIIARKVGAAVIVLDGDARAFLQGLPQAVQANENAPNQDCLAAV